MVTTRHLSTVLSFSLAALTSPALGQSTWHEPYTAQRTLGARLDSLLGGLLTQCGVGTLKEKTRFWKRDISNVPRVLQGNDMRRRIFALPSAYTMNVLRYAFDTTAVVGYNDLDANRRIDDAAFVSIVTPDYSGDKSSGWGHVQTCASVLAAAAELTLTAPVGSFASALKKEFSSTQKIVLLGGTFRSPLGRSLRNPANDAEERLALLAIYRLYTGNPSLDQRRPRYIDSFQGVSVLDLGDVSNSQDLRVGASASGNLVLAGAKGSINLSNSQSNNTRRWSYETYVYADTNASCPRGCILFDTLPSRIDVVARLAMRRVQYDGPTLRFIRNATGPVPISYLAPGIPEAFCGGWVTNQSPIGNATVTLEGQKKGQEPNTCQFSFVATLSKAAAQSSGQLLEVTHSLRSPTRFPQAEQPVLQFVARLVPTDDPRLIVGRFTPTGVPIPSPITGAPPLGFSWEIPVTFINGNAAVDFASVAKVDGEKLVCGGREHPITPIGSVGGSPADNLFRVRVERPLQNNEETSDSGRPSICTISAWLEVTLQAKQGMPSATARRWVEATVLLPPIFEKPPTQTSVPVSPPPLQ